MNRRQCRAGCPGTSSGSQGDEVAVQTRDVGRAERANVGDHDILRAVGRAHGVDYSALNFVRRPADVLQAQRRVAQQGATTPVIAKLEHPEALDHLDAILASADGVMIARGDPGVELPLERVLRIQKHIIQRATDAGVLVITHPRPTRATASDVTNAVLDGTDVVLRSGETAVGQYPVAAVDTMVHIIVEAERQAPGAVSAGRQGGDHAHALARAVASLARVTSMRPQCPTMATSAALARTRARTRPRARPKRTLTRPTGVIG